MDCEARDALASGREDLARLALRRQHLCLAEIDRFDRQIEGLLDEENQLANVERRASAQIEAALLRAEMAAVRRTAAQAQVAAGEALSSIGPIPDDTELVERIEREAEDLQARADAIEELIGVGILGQGLGRSDISYTSGGSESVADAEIELRLSALKQEQTAKPS